MKVSFSLLLAILGVARTKAIVCSGDPIVTVLYMSTDVVPPDGLIDVIQTDYTSDGAIMVKFDINNTFSVVNEEFFVQFNEQVVRAAYNDKCYAEEDVAINTAMAGESFEAVCMGHGTPFALINLYVLNANVTTSATLPKCCHGGDGSGIESTVDIKVDQYVYHVLCECPVDTPAPVSPELLTDTSPPSAAPSASPTAPPVEGPTAAPSASPSAAPSASPSAAPSASPSAAPSEAPTVTPNTYCETPAPPVIFESIAQGVCKDYAVHAQTTVTFDGEGTTVQDGDVGVSPGTSVTDASDNLQIVNGVINNGNTPFEKSVQLDHQLAMITRQDGHHMAIEMGGLTFTPGTYRSTSSINFASGTVVTLDGLNQENPVFLFQAVSTFVTAADTHFILKNGAHAENILWAVGSAATIGARSVIEGSIIASTSITLGTASAVHGCVLALAAITFESHGYVTLDGFGSRSGIQEYTDADGSVCDSMAEADLSENPSYGQHSICEDFAMYAGTTITFASAVQSVIVNGDIGVFPGTDVTHVTPPDFDTGFGIRNGDWLFGASVKAAHYAAMVARPDGQTMLAEMGGVTFTPGTYRASSSSNIAVNGVVTLNGLNEDNPVFVFQTTTALTTGADTSFNLINGARAENVLWAIGSSATLGENSVVAATILAKVSITLGTNSVVQGCALSQAAITTDDKATVGIDSNGSDVLLDYITGASNALTADVTATGVCDCDCYPQFPTEAVSFVDSFLINDVCENYGVYSDTSITFGSGHTTVHNGDVGSVGAITYVQDPNLVNGELINGNADTNPAFSISWKAKYDALWASRGDATTINAAMGSLTFTPGNYHSAAALSMAANTVVTLDGQNQVDPQFVFIAETALTTGADCHFKMINGAKAQNVLWVFGTAATFGADSVLEGSVLAGTFVTFGLRSVVRGCVLAKGIVSFADKGFVTFDTTVHTVDPEITVQYAMDSGEACPAPIVVTVEPVIDISEVDPGTYCETSSFGVESTSAAVCKNYAMHAETAISFSGEGSTVQSGDVGVSPGTAVTVASHLFVVDGEIINGNTAFQQSVRLNHALAIQVRTETTHLASPEIGGMTFLPGNYRSGSTINIAYNTFVTLDGGGDENAKFLFQAVTSLTTAAQTYFILKGGAKAENVLWAMGAAATLGADSVLEGSLIVGTSITFGTQARLHGCALALAAITMESKGYINFVGMGTNSPTEYTDASGAVCDSLSESISDSYSLHSVCQNYAVHARTTVTFASAASAIAGDVGVFPGTSVTYVNPIVFSGGGAIKYRDGDFAASVLHAHFEALNVRNDDTYTEDTDIGGRTFTPGTWRFASAINIASGTTITLDGDGVYLFQAGTTLITAANTIIQLTGGAQAKNVLWALGSAATLGANSVLEGSILAGTAITFGIGAELRGCALAQSAVTFESDGKVSYVNDGSDSLMDFLNDIDSSATSAASSVCTCDCYPAAATSLTSGSDYVSNGICQNYAVHAQTEVTFASSASTIHYGDVGSSGTGVTSVAELNLVNGVISNGNTGFSSSVTTAWVAAMAPQGTLMNIEMGGVTFTPGTYYSTSAINLVHGTVVTLDGDGDYLFQANTTLTTAADTYFRLINGAKAENVVWALGTAATLGARSVLQGSILAGTAITFGDMSILRGCALAQTAVTFESGGFVTFDSVAPTNGLEYTSSTGDSCNSPIAAVNAATMPFQSTEEQGLCENYAVHARTTVTFASDSPSRIEYGDVGVSPGTSVTNVTGIDFLNGTIANGDSAFASSVLAAHFAAIQVRTDGQSMEIELSGVTFTPGTYRSGSAINFALAGVVTLDGAGEYLFQAGSTLVTAADTTFTLINGAKAENVLWALGSAATLGANSVLPGSILAGTAITFGIGAELQGCALAQSAVTFEGGGSVILSPNRDPTYERRGLVGNRALLRGPN